MRRRDENRVDLSGVEKLLIVGKISDRKIGMLLCQKFLCGIELCGIVVTNRAEHRTGNFAVCKITDVLTAHISVSDHAETYLIHMFPPIKRIQPCFPPHYIGTFWIFQYFRPKTPLSATFPLRGSFDAGATRNGGKGKHIVLD